MTTRLDRLRKLKAEGIRAEMEYINKLMEAADDILAVIDAAKAFEAHKVDHWEQNCYGCDEFENFRKALNRLTEGE